MAWILIVTVYSLIRPHLQNGISFTLSEVCECFRGRYNLWFGFTFRPLNLLSKKEKGDQNILKSVWSLE